MTDQVFLSAGDAKRIAKLLQGVEGDEAEMYADLLKDHAKNHAVDDRWTEIGLLDEFIEQHA